MDEPIRWIQMEVFVIDECDVKSVEKLFLRFQRKIKRFVVFLYLQVENLRTQIDSFMQENPLISNEQNDEKLTKNSMKTMIPTRDTDDLPMKKKNFNSDEQNLVTIELVQVLHSKQSRIDELEKRLKDVEEQESQWRVNSSFSYDFVV